MHTLLCDDVVYNDPYGETHQGKDAANAHMNKMRSKLSTITGMQIPNFQAASSTVFIAKFSKLAMKITQHDTIEVMDQGLICTITRKKLE